MTGVKVLGRMVGAPQTASRRAGGSEGKHSKCLLPGLTDPQYIDESQTPVTAQSHDDDKYQWTHPSHPRVFIHMDTNGRHEPVEERKNVAVEDEYARHSKFGTTTPIEIGLSLTKYAIFLPIGPCVPHSSSSRKL